MGSNFDDADISKTGLFFGNRETALSIARKKKHDEVVAILENFKAKKWYSATKTLCHKAKFVNVLVITCLLDRMLLVINKCFAKIRNCFIVFLYSLCSVGYFIEISNRHFLIWIFSILTFDVHMYWSWKKLLEYESTIS